MEQWAQIEGWPYEISDEGTVRRTTGGQRTHVGRVRKNQLDVYGYPIVVLSRMDHWHQQRKTFRIHKYVAHYFIGPKPRGLQINHINGIKTDNRVENLEYVTASRNIKHALEIGLSVWPDQKGAANRQAKLTDDDIREIRRLRSPGRFGEGLPQKELAARFGVNVPTISNIVNRKTWRHIE